jgi:hypothetical protein
MITNLYNGAYGTSLLADEPRPDLTTDIYALYSQASLHPSVEKWFPAYL